MDEERIKRDIEWLDIQALHENDPKRMAELRGQADQLKLYLKMTKQNQQQLEQQTKQMQQAQQQEYERQEHEKKLEQEKLNNEKEILMLKTFDELSIPIAIYERFEERLFNTNVNKEDGEKYTQLLTSATELLNKRLENNKKFEQQLKGNTDYINHKVKYSEKYKNFERFINGEIIISDLAEKDFNIIKDTEVSNLLKKCKKNIDITSSSTFNKLRFIGYGIGAIVIITYSFWAGIFIIGGTLLAFNSDKIARKFPVRIRTEMKDKINKAINEQMIQEYTQNNVMSEEEKSIQNEMNEVQAKIQERSKTIIDQRLQDLYNFRVEHYNLKMEKLFYDVGLVNKCMENNYNWLDIDKKNIKNEGMYEDYFHYFNNYNPNNE